MKVTEIPVVIRALGTIPKRLVKKLKDLGMRGQMKTTQITALLRWA